MTLNALYAFGVAFVILGVSLRSMSEHGHARGVYAIWYVATFFFVLFFGMGVIAERRHSHLTDVCGGYKSTCDSLYEMFTNTQDEIALVTIVVSLAIAPQVLTYFLSGLSGAAAPPKYVAEISKLAVWSVVKFIAGLGGILLADPLSKLYVGRIGRAVDYSDIVRGFGVIAIAFALAALYLAVTERFLPLFRGAEFSDPVNVLIELGRRMHKHFVRHTQQSELLDKANDTAQDSTLPKI